MTVFCVSCLIVGFAILGYSWVRDEIEYRRPREPEPPMPGSKIILPRDFTR